ncbi:L-threonine ammonia-lyase [Candidatus Hydrogenisulfobacillus filiaventi]|uniref:L-threonine dehydratase catabolic TdcB n=1 Tax=Candidatus Hydrogenisulfobacillus filiaventi TaxID=2707344 RepID=A0A6F8ZK29_9FIRM|nr:threonine ammonia-lyase [Bacillota bacterium]CAB1130120.1 L-threonine ammonia-lyase [Candidatus Hydrogenisulfobacillus filiaventi]
MAESGLGAAGRPGIEEVRAAARALEGVAYRTPLQESVHINEQVGARVFLKLENLQRTGSFKLRGAYNRLRQLSPAELERGVVAASAGNHAQGVALAAQLVGTRATVVMPEAASLTKIEATRRYGAEVALAGDSFDESDAEAHRLAAAEGRVFIPAFDDPAVIVGQGTVALEILEERPALDSLWVPIGGGGLAAGVALAVKAVNPQIRVIGVQAEGAPAMLRSLEAGRVVTLPAVHTLADGMAVKRPGDLTFALVQRYVDEVVTVDERSISRAILLLLERTKLVVEGAGAAALAALLEGKAAPGAVAAAVVSGGNIDVTLLARIIEKGLVEEGRQVHLKTVLVDRPGQLSRLLQLVAAQAANVVRVEHERWYPGLSPTEALVHLVLETRDAAHVAAILDSLRQAGYPVEVLSPATGGNKT